MNVKQMIFVGLVVIGIVLLGFGFYGKHRMDVARGRIDTATGFIPEKRTKSFFSGELHGEVNQYILPVTLLFVGGVVFIIGGGIGIYYSRPRGK